MKLVKMTAAEKEKLEELLKKQEEADAQQRDFLREVRAQKDEVLKALGAVSKEEADQLKADAEDARKSVKEAAEAKTTAAKLQEIADSYGCSVGDLLQYIATDRQVSYYRSSHGGAKQFGLFQ